MGLATVDFVARKTHLWGLDQGSEEAYLFEETGNEIEAVGVDEFGRVVREVLWGRTIRLVALAHRLCADVP